jgi:hypothetical protein
MILKVIPISIIILSINFYIVCKIQMMCNLLKRNLPLRRVTLMVCLLNVFILMFKIDVVFPLSEYQSDGNLHL